MISSISRGVGGGVVVRVMSNIIEQPRREQRNSSRSLSQLTGSEGVFVGGLTGSQQEVPHAHTGGGGGRRWEKEQQIKLSAYISADTICSSSLLQI